ncbi:hypothetical protein [Sulfurovum sp.]|uniref:hypothetical protein n=1 Tax=Sulfurovum sp. TaxID=1969726 RepID=UPI0025D3CFD8|nr:hypothetical protein [Sulfurovum sp.]
MKNITLGIVLGFALMTLTGCYESDSGATKAETKKCQTGKCGEGKCGDAKKAAPKETETKKAEEPAK